MTAKEFIKTYRKEINKIIRGLKDYKLSNIEQYDNEYSIYDVREDIKNICRRDNLEYDETDLKVREVADYIVEKLFEKDVNAYTNCIGWTDAETGRLIFTDNARIMKAVFEYIKDIMFVYPGVIYFKH